ncbi:Hypothetical protein A7982_03133 [Minicystis rosea]|nr:Hypothetical protein A7982_03133 [Minicystis rosea]
MAAGKPVIRAWFFNFDADAELADPSARTPSRASLARARALVEKVRALLAPGDILVPDPPSDDALAAGCVGRAWCPTPRALDALTRAGARLPPTPSPATLRRVNHRRFSTDLGRALPQARWINTRADLDRTLAEPSPTGLWLLRRPFGFAGRGRLRLDPSRRDAVTERWIETTLAAGEGLEAAPWVERTFDCALHGHLSRQGTLVLGAPTVQRCDDTGAWLGSDPAGAGDLAPGERLALVAAAEQAAEALREARYFGPFGIDAFRFRDADGALRFEPRCEINARYSMGWAVGMGALRPDWDD